MFNKTPHINFLKRSATNLFIIFCVYAMVSSNAKLGIFNLPVIKQFFINEQYQHSKIKNLIVSLNQKFDFLIWIIGLKNHWRQFSPVDRYNWYPIYTAIYQSGEEVLLSLPNQTKRNFIQKNFIDYREAKYELNMHNSPRGQEAYAIYLCRHFGNKNNPVMAIRQDRRWQKILSPQEAKETGEYLHPNFGFAHIRTTSCQK